MLFGGTLTVHSRLGEGSRLELTLPLSEIPDQAIPSVEAANFAHHPIQ
jgi:hypothetical protein